MKDNINIKLTEIENKLDIANKQLINLLLIYAEIHTEQHSLKNILSDLNIKNKEIK